jgi:hypothetical protein
MPRTLTTRAARRMAAQRKTHGAGSGRPRKDAPRCPCQVMTLARAQARTSYEHLPWCSFYRARESR